MIIYEDRGDELWINPEVMKYLSEELMQFLKTRVHLTRSSFEKYAREQIERQRKILEDIERRTGVSQKSEVEDLIRSFSFDLEKEKAKLLLKTYLWFIYWKKRGIDPDEWRKKIFDEFKRRRDGENQNISSGIGVICLPRTVLTDPEDFKKSGFYLADAVVRAELIRIEKTSYKDPCYDTFMAIFLKKEEIWGKVEKDTFIVRFPSLEAFGRVEPYYFSENEIGYDFILFLSKFPLHRLDALPYVIFGYRYKKGEKRVDIDELEKEFLRLLRGVRDIKEMPFGEYELAYPGQYMVIYKGKIICVFVPTDIGPSYLQYKLDYELKKPSTFRRLFTYEEFKSAIRDIFKTREGRK